MNFYFGVQGHFKVISRSNIHNSMKIMVIPLLQYIFWLDLQYLVGILPSARPVVTINFIDLGQGQGHSDQGQTSNIGGNNIWISGFITGSFSR